MTDMNGSEEGMRVETCMKREVEEKKGNMEKLAKSVEKENNNKKKYIAK